jgi:D-beta-D-heptose 7-phosphate kinase/D-beta-D-heptose 1-phosphate adenosyltransferase
MSKKIVLVTGGFDPLHSGHIAYFQEAKKLGDILVIGVNSDAWLARKKGRPFMPLSERTSVIRSLKMVDFVIDFDDSDGSAREAIRMVRQSYPQDQIIFANGGDRVEGNIPGPEADFQDDNIKFVYGVGGFNKANSSSWILEEWRAPKTPREWGYYRVLFEPNKNVKLKELTVESGQRLSMQRHEQRNEFWFVSEGTATVYTLDSSTDIELLGTYTAHQNLFIPQRSWHQLCNETDAPLKLIEIQYGDACQETDIERK